MATRDLVYPTATRDLTFIGVREDVTPPRSELEAAMTRVLGELREGLAHGFFDFSMSCEVIRGGKRRFTLRAGKSHRFVIPEEDLK